MVKLRVLLSTIYISEGGKNKRDIKDFEKLIVPTGEQLVDKERAI